MRPENAIFKYPGDIINQDQKEKIMIITKFKKIDK